MNNPLIVGNLNIKLAEYLSQNPELTPEGIEVNFDSYLRCQGLLIDDFENISKDYQEQVDMEVEFVDYESVIYHYRIIYSPFLGIVAAELINRY